jgi:hypothetical protein
MVGARLLIAVIFDGVDEALRKGRTDGTVSSFLRPDAPLGTSTVMVTRLPKSGWIDVWLCHGPLSVTVLTAARTPALVL